MTFNADTYMINVTNNTDGTYTMNIQANVPGLTLVTKKTEDNAHYLSNFDESKTLTYKAADDKIAYSMAIAMARKFFKALSSKLEDALCVMSNRHGMDVEFDMAWQLGSEEIQDEKEDGHKTNKYTGLRKIYLGSTTAHNKNTLPFIVVAPAYKEAFKFVCPVETKRKDFSLFFELDPVDYNTKYPYRRKNGRRADAYSGEYTEMDETFDTVETALKNVNAALDALTK